MPYVDGARNIYAAQIRQQRCDTERPYLQAACQDAKRYAGTGLSERRGGARRTPSGMGDVGWNEINDAVEKGVGHTRWYYVPFGNGKFCIHDWLGVPNWCGTLQEFKAKYGGYTDEELQLGAAAVARNRQIQAPVNEALLQDGGVSWAERQIASGGPRMVNELPPNEALVRELNRITANQGLDPEDGGGKSLNTILVIAAVLGGVYLVTR